MPAPGRRTAAGAGPVAGAFITLGMFWGSWAVAVANVQRTFHLSYADLGLLLAVAIAVAGLSGAVVGHRAERWGTGPMLTGSLAVWGALLVATGLARAWPVFAVAFCAAEAAAGSVDTAMNAAASHRLAGRPGALIRFHALFNTGALAGAAVAGVVLAAGVSWRWLWPVLAAAVAAVAWWSTRARRPLDPAPGPDAGSDEGPAGGSAAGSGPDPAPDPARGDRPARAPGPLAQLRADRLLVFLAVFALAEVAEGGVDTWGVLYLRTHLAAGVLLGAGAYVVGQAVAATTRGGGGPLLGRLPVRTALVVGGLLAAGGILVESVSPAAVAAAAGLAAAAAGASLFWPLVMSQVNHQASRPTAAAGTFTAAGYVGWVAGAPVVGWVSDTFGPSRGLQLLALLAGVVVVAALWKGDRSPGPGPVG